jgi:uncharacterized protein (TIGR03435 family)
MRTRALLAVLSLAAGPAVVSGQEPSFEVASVRVNTSGDPVSRISAPAGTGRFEATNAPLRILIVNAYGIAGFQLAGGPAWLDGLRVDIVARAATPVARDEISRMLRRLLSERFQLAVHRESREAPVYALVVARDDRRLGPRMQASTADCAAATAGGAAAPQLPSGQLLCATRMSPTWINAGGMTMARLATSLTGIVGGPVTDETRLTGTYDLQLSFSPEQPLPPGAPPPADPNAPSIFAALEEQLGLKLDARRGMVDFVVIDRVEPPTGN